MKMKKMKPIMMTKKDTKKLVESTIVHLKISSKKTLESWPWANDKAQSLR